MLPDKISIDVEYSWPPGKPDSMGKSRMDAHDGRGFVTISPVIVKHAYRKAKRSIIWDLSCANYNLLYLCWLEYIGFSLSNDKYVTAAIVILRLYAVTAATVILFIAVRAWRRFPDMVGKELNKIIHRTCKEALLSILKEKEKNENSSKTCT